MRNILVTGGAGYIGAHVAVELIDAGYKPVIVDSLVKSDVRVIDNIAKITGQRPPFYKTRAGNKSKIKQIIAKEKIDGVIHFAAFKAPGESSEIPLAYYKNNVAELIDLLEALEETNVPNLVFSSSCVVYGDPNTPPLTEDSPLKSPAAPYGVTKQMGETIIKDVTRASDSLSSLSLRYFNPIGAHPSALIGELPLERLTTFIPHVTQAAMGQIDELIVYGGDYDTTDGTCVRDFIHVVDLARAHVKALEYLQKQNTGFYDVFNIGTGRGVSLLKMIKIFEKATGVKVPYQIGPRRAGDIVVSYASAQKAHKILHWEAQKSLEEAMVDTWRWQKTFDSHKKHIL